MQHRVDFKPEEDNSKMKKALVHLGDEKIGCEYLFDGTMMFATRRLDKVEFSVKDPAVSTSLTLSIVGNTVYEPWRWSCDT